MAEKRRYATVVSGDDEFQRVLVVPFKDEAGNHICDGHVVRWSQHCTGCTETPECTIPEERGSGCEECGYTGRRRRREWVPLTGEDHRKYTAWSDAQWKSRTAQGDSNNG